MSEDKADYQRLDTWLWCARFARGRSDCVRMVQAGTVRINRQATDKAHAKLRVGDVLTLPLRNEVVVLRVMALAARRGSAAQARILYDLLAPAAACAEEEISPYAPDRVPGSDAAAGSIR